MFLYPEPPPIGYYIDDVSPSILTDGVLQHGPPGPTHKCVGKQLIAIPRKLGDPVAPKAEVTPRMLERWANQSTAWFVDGCGRNARALHAMLARLPEEKIDLYYGWKSKCAVFPRSEQYEYWYVRNKRLSDLEKLKKGTDTIKCMEVEKNPCRGRSSALECSESPFWWLDAPPVRVGCTVGNPNDYKYDRLDPPGARDLLIRKRLQLEDPEVYAPGDIYKEKHPEENSMQEALDRADAVKVVIRGEGAGGAKNVSEEAPDICSCQLYAPQKVTICYPEDEVTTRADAADEIDSRWHPLYDVLYVPKDDSERAAAMTKVQKPYLHEMNTWYSKCKPVKLFPLSEWRGRKPS